MKYFNGLQMGEGIAGPKTIGTSTTVIYSCMGIAFVNRARCFGGLYHYPANTLNNANVSGTIRQMYNDIQPDEIVLTPAEMVMGVGSSQDDIDAITKFLKSLNNNVTVAAARNSAQLIWIDNKPVFNEHPGGDEPQAVNNAIRGKMSTGGRELEGNIWYYGGNGETDGVLDQGLQTTKQSAKGCCTIM